MITDPTQLPEAAHEELRCDSFARVRNWRRLDGWQQNEQVCPRDGCASFTPVRLAGDERELRLCDACERLYEVLSDQSSRASDR